MASKLTRNDHLMRIAKFEREWAETPEWAREYALRYHTDVEIDITAEHPFDVEHFYPLDVKSDATVESCYFAWKGLFRRVNEYIARLGY